VGPAGVNGNSPQFEPVRIRIRPALDIVY
jgi:hypothetical protein